MIELAQRLAVVIDR